MLAVTAVGCSEEDIKAAMNTQQEAEETEDDTADEEDQGAEDSTEDAEEKEEDAKPADEVVLELSDDNNGSAPVSNFSEGSVSVAEATLDQCASEFGISVAELKGVCQCIGSHVAQDYLQTRELDYVKLDAPAYWTNTEELIDYYVNSARMVDQDLQCDDDTRTIAVSILESLLDYYDNDTDMVGYLVLEHGTTFQALMRNLDISAN